MNTVKGAECRQKYLMRYRTINYVKTGMKLRKKCKKKITSKSGQNLKKILF